jgi:hypothetical protein
LIMYVAFPFSKVKRRTIKLDSLNMLVFKTNAGVEIFITVILFYPNLYEKGYQNRAHYHIV